MFNNYNEMEQFFIDSIVDQLHKKYGLSVELLRKLQTLNARFAISNALLDSEFDSPCILLDTKTPRSATSNESAEALLVKELESKNNSITYAYSVFARLDYVSPFEYVQAAASTGTNLSMIISHKEESGEVTYYSLQYTWDSYNGYSDARTLKVVKPVEKTIIVYE